MTTKTAETPAQARCPYCHKGKPIVDDNLAFVGVESDAGQLWFNSDKFVGEDEADFVTIAYCPMCGRRLDE
jgi:O-methyltransferase involved in polyketide biosynthesis